MSKGFKWREFATARVAWLERNGRTAEARQLMREVWADARREL